MKICCPVSCATYREIAAAKAVIIQKKPDILELRADYLSDPAEIPAALILLSETNIPVLFTMRRKEEGGRSGASDGERLSVILGAIGSGLIKYADAELSSGALILDAVTKSAKENGVSVIVSYHDFTATPDIGSLLKIMKAAALTGADIVKVAVMPINEADVETLKKAAALFKKEHPQTGVIAVSMGELGRKTRICGSCITYAQLLESTAPGQIGIDELRGLI